MMTVIHPQPRQLFMPQPLLLGEVLVVAWAARVVEMQAVEVQVEQQVAVWAELAVELQVAQVVPQAARAVEL